MKTLVIVTLVLVAATLFAWFMHCCAETRRHQMEQEKIEEDFNRRIQDERGVQA